MIGAVVVIAAVAPDWAPQGSGMIAAPNPTIGGVASTIVASDWTPDVPEICAGALIVTVAFDWAAEAAGAIRAGAVMAAVAADCAALLPPIGAVVRMVAVAAVCPPAVAGAISARAVMLAVAAVCALLTAGAIVGVRDRGGRGGLRARGACDRASVVIVAVAADCAPLVPEMMGCAPGIATVAVALSVRRTGRV